MAIKLTTVDEAIAENGQKILVCGMSGTGKTTLCATANCRTLIINTEKGLKTLKKFPKHIKDNIDVATISQIEELGELYGMLEDGDHPYGLIAIDSITEVTEVLLARLKDEVKDPRQAYGQIADQMLAMIKLFRDLPKTNVLMIAKSEMMVNEDGIERFTPMLPGKQLPKQLEYLFDEVFAARVVKIEGENRYLLQTNKDIKYICKDRDGSLDFLEEPDLEVILKKLGADTKKENTDQIVPEHIPVEIEEKFEQSKSNNLNKLQQSIQRKG